MEINLLPRNNNAPHQPQPDPENNNPLTAKHYKDWYRLLKKTNRLRESIIKFLINFVLFSGETASLVVTLLTGIVVPESRNETVAAILFYLLTCIITSTVVYFNQSSTKSRQSESKSALKELLKNMLFMTKPIRYVKQFQLRRSRLRIIDSEREGEVISEQKLKSLAELNAGELEEKRLDFYECFFQSIPMTLLQAYFLFQTHEQFRLCSVTDLSRLLTILFAQLHAAKSAAMFEASKQDLEQTLHFLAYFKSKGNHPMVIFSSDMLSTPGLLNIVAHFTTILSRFYTTTFFMTISPLLSILYLFSFFLVNLCLLKLAPQHLLVVHENPPHGVSTLPSSIADRIINIFSNVGTRFNVFTDKAVCFSTRLPLLLILPIQAILPILVVYSTSYYYGISGDLTPSVITPLTQPTTTQPPTSLNETLSTCPELNSFMNIHPLLMRAGTSIFSSYRSVDDRFETYNDIFGVGNLLWLLFYAQILAIWVYAYSDLIKRKVGSFGRDVEEGGYRGEEYYKTTYPILTGYSFYNVLLTNAISTRDVMRIRKLMLLTVLHEDEFYSAIRTFGIFRRSDLSDKTCWKLIKTVVGRLTVPDNLVEMKINVCISEGHRFLTEFLEIRDILFNQSEGEDRIVDKKLFLGFFGYFDKKVCLMSSDRVGRVFMAVEGVKAVRAGEVWEDE